MQLLVKKTKKKTLKTSTKEINETDELEIGDSKGISEDNVDK